MKQTLSVALVAALVLAAGAAVVLAMGSTHPKDYVATQQEGWPAGLADLINSKGRVCGIWVNGSDWFSYAGDTKAFNAFIEPYAQLKGIPLVLVLHPGRGMTGGLGEPQTIPYEWCLSVIRRGWGADMPEAYKNSPSQVVVTINLYLGGNVALDELEAPTNIEVTSGGEIEKFIVHHEAKRSLTKPAK